MEQKMVCSRRSIAVLVSVAAAAIISSGIAEKISFSSNYRGQQINSGPGWDIRVYSVSSPTEDISAIFDTSSPTGNDYDLGSPNEKCGGPGKGRGGAPGYQGENCNAVGNVLIAYDSVSNLSNFRTTCTRYCDPSSEEADPSLCNGMCQPTDDHSGAIFKIRFEDDVRILTLRMLDIDNGEKLLVTKTPYQVELMPVQEVFLGTGDNSVLSVSAEAFGEFRIGDYFIITCEHSCALIDLEYERTAEPMQNSPDGADFLLPTSTFITPSVQPTPTLTHPTEPVMTPSMIPIFSVDTHVEHSMAPNVEPRISPNIGEPNMRPSVKPDFTEGSSIDPMFTEESSMDPMFTEEPSMEQSEEPTEEQFGEPSDDSDGLPE